MISGSSICLRCFDYHQHQRQQCKRNAVICCSICYRLNYLTRECCDGPEQKQNDEYPQVFRMVGTDKTYFYTDVKVGTKFSSAFINTNLSTSKIDWATLNELTTQPNYRYTMSSKTVPLPIVHKSTTFTLNCEYGSLPNLDRIELGMDYLTQTGATLKLNGLFLKPFINGLPSTSKESRYIIYVRIYGKQYEAIIDTGIAKSRIDFSTVLMFEKRSNKHHVFDLLNATVDLTIEYENKSIPMNFIVRGMVTKGPKIRLGTDFLKLNRFSFLLGGIELNILNPWKTTDSNNIDFAYNHPMGQKLRTLILVGHRRYRFQENHKRPILKRPDIHGNMN